MSDKRRSLPPGPFVKVTVIVTPREYETLLSEAALLGPGTTSAAVRKRIGWYVTPYGYKRWLKEHGL